MLDLGLGSYPGSLAFSGSGWGQEPAFLTSSLKTQYMLTRALYFEKHKGQTGWPCLTAETSEDQVEVQSLGKQDTELSGSCAATHGSFPWDTLPIVYDV